MLHHDNPDLIEEPVDEWNSCAIHIAAEKENYDLLEYLLRYGANVNAIGTRDKNTALHIACIHKDVSMIRLLFAYSIDDEIPNGKKKKAIDLLPKKNKQFRREFLKAKNFRNKNKLKEEQEKKRNQTLRANDIQVAGMALITENSTQIRKYMKETDHRLNFISDKTKEIKERRGVCITAFGKQTGVDIDEIAITFNKLPNKPNLWNKWNAVKKDRINNNPNTMTKQIQINKMLFGLTWIALKNKKAKNIKKPNPKSIKFLTKKLFEKLPHDSKTRKRHLTKDDFEKKLLQWLFDIHDEIVAEDEERNSNYV